MTTKRERELERAKAARQAERRDQDARQRRLRTAIGGVAAAALLVIGGAVIANALGGDDPAPVSPAPTSAASAPQTPTQSSAAVACNKPGDVQTNAQQFPDGPGDLQLPSDSTLGLNLETNCGKIEIEFNKTTPKNVESLIFLANTGAPLAATPGVANGETIEVQGFFDNTLCHRLTSEGIFVLQCGDPLGNGSGGPGYTVDDEDLARVAESFADAGNGRVVYPRGTIAMANSGPDTNGSQFFIVYKDSPLAPAYTVVGKVTKGLEIIDKVAAVGSTPEGDGQPNQPLELQKVLSFERRQVT